MLIDFQGGDSGAHAETSNFSAVADIAFGASEIRVLDAEVPNTGQYVNFDTPRSWRRIQVTNYRGIYVAIAPVRFQGGATLLRLHVDAAASDGPGACYLTSPALFEYPGANNQLWDSAESNAEVYIDKDTNRFRVDYAPLDDAIVTMFVHDEVPDRSVLDAGGLVSGHSTQVTCTGLIPAQEQGDPFSIERELAAQSNCASVQTFRATNAATSLNLRVFVAGILISAAVAMLLEALATGGTEDRRSVPGAK